MIKIGLCGLGFSAKEQFGKDWRKKYTSKLQGFATKFPVLEINTSFYKIPSEKTAKKWRKEADVVNKKFEFVLKMYQGITHFDKFGSQKSIKWFNACKKIAKILKAKILLFQTPASFKPTEKNILKAKKFFKKIKRDKFALFWEVRWEKDWPQKIVKPLFKELKINQVIDPFRFKDYYGRTCYYRLHGMGKFNMYMYKFSKKELKTLIPRIPKKSSYIMFNNAWMYENAEELKEMLEEQ
ncbi:hypothetical protein DRJ22_03895 [Candidatus Woesearchaeota archaeon]|nr:MAG: hypothetical protein B6U93_01895 [Candidatus Woesearchaeota archaeon ex4484_78]RLE45661.1 MAG: hypothetical protein DRJ22_03895 [Candidatus Woesearchaeota archaeon]